MNLRYDWAPVERYECNADMNTRLRVDLNNIFSHGRNEWRRIRSRLWES